MKAWSLALGVALMLVGGYFFLQSNMALGGGAFAVGLIAIASARRKL
ncbi:MAG: hypothetical protein V2I39_07695 [Erythrobacter sp.]|nr:hypothetical protein [Erythrobacter sp.]